MSYSSAMAVCVFAYLLGSIPFGLLLTKLAGLGDIRTIGSGNIGATNVLRTGKKSLAVLTVLLDGGKGAVAVLAVNAVDPGLVPFAALAALLGHLFPVWLKFKGGKGVATTLGILLALAWPVGLITIALWALVALVTRYSSLAALVSIGLSPVTAALCGYRGIVGVAVIIVGLVLFTHRANIQRLLAGTESRIGKN